MQQLAWLYEKLLAAYGHEPSDRIVAGYRAKRRVTFRTNTLKSDPQTVRETLMESGISCEPIPWYTDAFVANNASERDFERLSLYGEGKIYLQSLSSMLPPLFLGAKEGESILDMTAAPGGKTTQISALTGGMAFITACEKDKLRFDRLRYNIEKQGAPRVTVLYNDALKLDDFFRFDRILLDAPCSGSGTLLFSEKSPKISPQLVKNSALLQEKLLIKALKLLKKGGTLIYSTCSVLPEENGEVVLRALRSAGGELQEISAPEGVPTLPCLTGTLTVCPDDRYEGFFVAKILRK